MVISFCLPFWHRFDALNLIPDASIHLSENWKKIFKNLYYFGTKNSDIFFTFAALDSSVQPSIDLLDSECLSSLWLRDVSRDSNSWLKRSRIESLNLNFPPEIGIKNVNNEFSKNFVKSSYLAYRRRFYVYQLWRKTRSLTYFPWKLMAWGGEDWLKYWKTFQFLKSF